MKRRTLWVVLGVGGFVAALAFLRKRPLRAGMRVVHVGDSHVGGLKVALQALLTPLGVGYEAHFRNGISTVGALSAGWPVRGADVILVTLGTNDTPAQGYVEAVASLVRQLRQQAPEAALVWWGPPSLHRSDVIGLPNEIVPLQRQAVTALGGVYVDSRPWASSDAADGVHLTRDGYARWADGALKHTFRIG